MRASGLPSTLTDLGVMLSLMAGLRATLIQEEIVEFIYFVLVV